MPTPVGHSLAALTLQLAGRKTITRSVWMTRALVIAIGSMPDLDFIPGYLVGDPRLYHWGPAHSFAAALLAGVVGGLIAKSFTGRFRIAFVLITAVYSSHIFLDLLLGPGNPDIGIQIFWPFSAHRFMARWEVFMMFPDSITRVGPIAALFSRGILPVIARELVVLLPLVAAAWGWSLLSERRVRAPDFS